MKKYETRDLKVLITYMETIYLTFIAKYTYGILIF